MRYIFCVDHQVNAAYHWIQLAISTRRYLLVEQELYAHPEYLRSPLFKSGFVLLSFPCSVLLIDFCLLSMGLSVFLWLTILTQPHTVPLLIYLYFSYTEFRWTFPYTGGFDNIFCFWYRQRSSSDKKMSEATVLI